MGCEAYFMHYHNYKLLQFILCIGMVLWTFKWSFWQWNQGSNSTTLRYTWWCAVSLFFCYKPLWGGGWDFKPQLLASHCAPAELVDLSIHSFLRNSYAFCLSKPQNHQREKSPWWFHVLFWPRKTPESLNTQKTVSHSSSSVDLGKQYGYVVAYSPVFTY